MHLTSRSISIALLAPGAAAVLVAQQKAPAKYRSPEVHSDGTVTLRLAAPGAKEVRLGGNLPGRVDSRMERGSRGLWTKTVGPLEPGIYPYGFSVDGSPWMADPANPEVHQRQGNPALRSLLTVPGPEPDFFEVRDVPHGEVHAHWYRAGAVGETRRLLVYTPPGYERENEKRFPVLYLLHGGSDREEAWIETARANVILDNLLAEGNTVPMVMVTPLSKGVAPYVRLPSGGVDRTTNFEEFERTFFADVLPLVEKRYRVRSDAEGRAVAGFSVGAALSRRVGLRHLDQFAWIGLFSGGLREAEGYEELITKLTADPDTAKRKLKLLWVSGPENPSASENAPGFFRHLDRLGIPYVSRPDRFGHSYRTCRHILYHDFLPRLFR
ncbi:MAG: esterase [bacterium]|nr:esterase [bacterium]